MAGERVIVFGKVGSGKSTLCNMLHAREPRPARGFPVHDDLTRASSRVESKAGHGWITVDTVGVLTVPGVQTRGPGEGGTVSEDEAIDGPVRRLTKFLREVKNTYKYIIYVVEKGPLREEDKIVWKLFKEIFRGGESNFVVVYTKATEAWIESRRGELSEFYGVHERSFIAVDFPGDDDEDDELQDRRARRRTLKRSLRDLALEPTQLVINQKSDDQLLRYAERILDIIRKWGPLGLQILQLLFNLES